MSFSVLHKKQHEINPLSARSLTALDAPAIRKDLSYHIFRFFASLKLAVMLILSLIIVFSAGTFLESSYGAETAALTIYQSPWMTLLLVLLGINVAAAAIDRLPWKKKHVGFVTTHAGIIILLIGSLITQKWMIDGQMAITEGETEHRITLPQPLLYVFSEKERKDWLIPFRKEPFQWRGERALKPPKQDRLPLELSLVSYFPKARIREEIVPSQDGPAAVEFAIQNSFIQQTHALMQGDPETGSISVGPAQFVISDTFLNEAQGELTEAGYLEFRFADDNFRLPLKEDLQLPHVEKLAGTAYQITVLRIFKSAAIMGRELIEQAVSGEMDNPAAELMIEGGGISEKHTVFAKFPDFPTRHGMKPSETGAQIFYRLPNGGSQGETHQLRFVPQGDRLFYQVQDGFEVKRGEVAIGEPVSTGWMDLTFQANAFYPHARLSKSFLPEPNTASSEEIVPAIQIRATKGSDTQTLWLGQGLRETLDLAGEKFHFLYGQKRIPAGFRLLLKDFKIEHYPGTNRPASFESDVILKDDMRGIEKEVNISMNHPLIHRGFRIYQSGYHQSPGQPDVSIFAVGKDPGVPLKYLGAIVMVAGIVTMFYIRRFSSHAGKLSS